MKQTKPKSDVSVEVDGNEAQKFAQRKVDFKKQLNPLTKKALLNVMKFVMILKILR